MYDFLGLKYIISEHFRVLLCSFWLFTRYMVLLKDHTVVRFQPVSCLTQKISKWVIFNNCEKFPLPWFDQKSFFTVCSWIIMKSNKLYLLVLKLDHILSGTLTINCYSIPHCFIAVFSKQEKLLSLKRAHDEKNVNE